MLPLLIHLVGKYSQPQDQLDTNDHEDPVLKSGWKAPQQPQQRTRQRGSKLSKIVIYSDPPSSTENDQNPVDDEALGNGSDSDASNGPMNESVVNSSTETLRPPESTKQHAGKAQDPSARPAKHRLPLWVEVPWSVYQRHRAKAWEAFTDGKLSPELMRSARINDSKIKRGRDNVEQVADAELVGAADDAINAAETSGIEIEEYEAAVDMEDAADAEIEDHEAAMDIDEARNIGTEEFEAAVQREEPVDDEEEGGHEETEEMEEVGEGEQEDHQVPVEEAANTDEETQDYGQEGEGGDTEEETQALVAAQFSDSHHGSERMEDAPHSLSPIINHAFDENQYLDHWTEDSQVASELMNEKLDSLIDAIPHLNESTEIPARDEIMESQSSELPSSPSWQDSPHKREFAEFQETLDTQPADTPKRRRGYEVLDQIAIQPGHSSSSDACSTDTSVSNKDGVTTTAGTTFNDDSQYPDLSPVTAPQMSSPELGGRPPNGTIAPSMLLSNISSRSATPVEAGQHRWRAINVRNKNSKFH